jgi:hypothetical protein
LLGWRLSGPVQLSLKRSLTPFVPGFLATIEAVGQARRGSQHMPMKNPPRRGKHRRATCLQAPDSLVTAAAGVSPGVTIRFEQVGWGAAESLKPDRTPPFRTTRPIPN